MLKVQNITKSSLPDISFEIESGVIGITGGNGADRSALLSIIAGVMAPDSGHIYIDEYDISVYPTESKRATGYMAESMSFYEDMTSYEFLVFIGEAKKIQSEKLHKQIGEALDLLDITHISDVLISNIRADEKKFLGVASTLLGNPDIIILDSPFKNISPSDKEKLSHIIKMLGTMKVVIISDENSAALDEIASEVITLSSDSEMEVGE